MAGEHKIWIINRNNYDDLQTIDSGSIYLVRENTSDTILSMYLGEAKQSDVFDISSRVTIDPLTKNYIIPSEFQVENKLFFCEDKFVNTSPNTSYKLFMWKKIDENSGYFVDCLASSNVHVYADLPDTQSALSENVYVCTSNNDRGVYVFDGNDFIGIITKSQLDNFVTKDYVDQQLAVDNYTVKRVSNKLTGAGALVSGIGVTFTDVDGQNKTVYPGTGAHIYNNYNPENSSLYYLNCNVAKGDYSNAFGFKSRALAYGSFAAGADIRIDEGAPCAIALGRGLYCNSSACTVIGSYNKLTSSTDHQEQDYVFVIGNGSTNVNRSDALSVDWNGNVVLYGDNTVNKGNIKSATGATLSTIRDSITGNQNSDYVDDYLPQNSHEVRLNTDLSALSNVPITSVQVNNLSLMLDGTLDDSNNPNTVSRSSDYSCVYIFNKDSSVTDASSLMTNFTSTNQTETTVGSEPPRIYLINPSVDISGSTIIHIFLFYDGFKICAIVGGYDIPV